MFFGDYIVGIIGDCRAYRNYFVIGQKIIINSFFEGEKLFLEKDKDKVIFSFLNILFFGNFFNIVLIFFYF